jgi:hypothetical protein
MLSSATSAAKDDLTSFLGASNTTEFGPVPDHVFEAFLRYYATVSYVGCDRSRDADMLLFEYGVYDWGEGKRFQLDFVRQFIVGDLEDESQLEQLRLTLFYPPEVAGDAAPYDVWSHVGLETYADRVRKSPGFRAASAASPGRMQIEHELV